MSNLNISYFRNVANASVGGGFSNGTGTLQAAKDLIVTEELAITGSNAQSAVAPAGVSIVRVLADVDAFVAIGTNPNATTATARVKVKAGMPEYFGIEVSQKVAGATA